MSRSLIAFLACLICQVTFGQDFFLDSALTNRLAHEFIQKDQTVYFRLSIESNQFVEIAGFGKVVAFDSTEESFLTGTSLLEEKKSYASYRNILKLDKGEYLVKAETNQPLFDKEKVSISYFTENEWRSEERTRFIAHGLFFGIIIVMSLYNLMIYFAVKDESYLWYVFSIIGFGLYMSFYYGFSKELIWPSQPHWNTHFFALIIPLTNIGRIQFTRAYLHTKEYVPKWHNAFRILLFLYAVPLLGWAYCYAFSKDWLWFVNHIIGTLGTINMIMITIVSMVVFRRGYTPAFWFLLAFLLFNFGGILFIFMELGYLPDTFFTRYVVQIGAVAQVILFSFGLSSRLNRTRKRLSVETIEKERMARQQEIDKKNLIERERKKLEKQVKNRTQELESILTQLKLSEEELRELNQVKNRLFSIISHELKNPLTTVDSFLNLMINHHDKLTENERADLSNKTKFALQNLTLLLDNLMQWSRLQQERLVFLPKPLGLLKVVERSIKLFKLLIDQKNLTIEISSDLIQYSVYADKDMLEFIIRNIIHNSIKFTPKNGRIFVSAESYQDHLIKCSITDSGVGMNQEMITQILDGNKAFSTTGTEEEKGSGLGLIMCKDFVQKNGGELHIESKRGTSVSFTIPREALTDSVLSEERAILK